MMMSGSLESNNSGQLELGDRWHRYVPSRIPNLKAKFVSAGNTHTVLIDLNDDVWVFGENNAGQLGLGDNVWTFGWNFAGQLGLGDQLSRIIPTRIPNLKGKSVSAGDYHTIVIGTRII